MATSGFQQKHYNIQLSHKGELFLFFLCLIQRFSLMVRVRRAAMKWAVIHICLALLIDCITTRIINQ